MKRRVLKHYTKYSNTRSLRLSPQGRVYDVSKKSNKQDRRPQPLQIDLTAPESDETELVDPDPNARWLSGRLTPQSDDEILNDVEVISLDDTPKEPELKSLISLDPMAQV